MLPFVFIFLLVGIALIVGGRKMKSEAIRAAQWPVADGVLESCEVVEVPGAGADDLGSWQLRLKYSYVVRGVTYHSTRYAIGYGDSQDDKKHRLVAETLKRSPKLSVHYDPKHPSEALLNTEMQGNVQALGYFFLVLTALSLLIVVSGR